jgi:hypothetical protein
MCTLLCVEDLRLESGAGWGGLGIRRVRVQGRAPFDLLLFMFIHVVCRSPSAVKWGWAYVGELLCQD